MWLEQRQQQVRVEQENLERLREEQLKQEKEREEIRCRTDETQVHSDHPNLPDPMLNLKEIFF
jgi:hypothetical protein